MKNLNKDFTAITGEINELPFYTIELSHDSSNKTITIQFCDDDGGKSVEFDYTVDVEDISSDPEATEPYYVDMVQSLKYKDRHFEDMGLSFGTRRIIQTEIDKIDFELMSHS